MDETTQRQQTVPEIIVEAPVGVGMLLAQAEEWQDTAALDAFTAVFAGAIEAAVEYLRSEAGAVDPQAPQRASGPGRARVEPTYEYHLRAGLDTSGTPQPHAHLTLAPRQTFQQASSKQVEARQLENVAALAQQLFSAGVRQGLQDLGFHISQLPTRLAPVGWELSVYEDHTDQLPQRELCPPSIPGQRQLRPVGRIDRTRIGA